MKEVTLIIAVYFFFCSLREAGALYKNIKKGEYINGNKLHNIQHIIMIIMLMGVWIGMFAVCTNEYLTPILLYQLVVIFYIIPHLKNERDELNY